jgi:hypothetical protein
MCEMVRKVKKPTARVITVWKCFHFFETFWTPLTRPGEFPLGKWVRAENPDYGFNCYRSRAVADTNWSEPPRKCRARFVEGYGDEGVIFVRELFVPRPRTKKKRI